MENEINNSVTEPIEGQPDQESKMYTQEEVDSLLQKEADRRVTEALKKVEKKKEAAVAEAKKLAQMDAQQRYEYELQQREKAIEDKERELMLAENKNEAGRILSEKGISLELVDFVVAESADDMYANIQKLEKAFKNSVKAEVERRMSSSVPKKNLPLDTTITREGFAKMTLAQQAELYHTNPDLYRDLTT